MDDIVEAMRNTTDCGADPDLIYRAAEEMEHLQAENTRLKSELEATIKERNAFQDQCISRSIKEALRSSEPDIYVTVTGYAWDAKSNPRLAATATPYYASPQMKGE